MQNCHFTVIGDIVSLAHTGGFIETYEHLKYTRVILSSTLSRDDRKLFN